MQRSAFYIRSGIGPIQATTHAAPSFAREDCVGGRRPEVIGVGGGGGRGEGDTDLYTITTKMLHAEKLLF